MSKDVRSAQEYANPLVQWVKENRVPLFLKESLQWPEKIEEMQIV